jgi:hypothetical protein
MFSLKIANDVKFCVMDSPQPDTEPVLTLDQKAMRTARLFDEAKQANPKGKTLLGDIARQENTPQTWVALASFICQHCPAEALAIERKRLTNYTAADAMVQEFSPVHEDCGRSRIAHPGESDYEILPLCLGNESGHAVSTNSGGFSQKFVCRAVI